MKIHHFFACEVSGMVVIRSVQVMMSSDHSSTNWAINRWAQMLLSKRDIYVSLYIYTYIYIYTCMYHACVRVCLMDLLPRSILCMIWIFG